MLDLVDRGVDSPRDATRVSRACLSSAHRLPLRVRPCASRTSPSPPLTTVIRYYVIVVIYYLFMLRRRPRHLGRRPTVPHHHIDEYTLTFCRIWSTSSPRCPSVTYTRTCSLSVSVIIRTPGPSTSLFDTIHAFLDYLALLPGRGDQYYHYQSPSPRRPPIMLV